MQRKRTANGVCVNQASESPCTPCDTSAVNNVCDAADLEHACAEPCLRAKECTYVMVGYSR